MHILVDLVVKAELGIAQAFLSSAVLLFEIDTVLNALDGKLVHIMVNVGVVLL